MQGSKGGDRLWRWAILVVISVLPVQAGLKAHRDSVVKVELRL